MLSKLFRRLFLERLAAAHDAGRLQFFGYGKRWQAEAVMALAGLGIMPPSDPCRHAGGPATWAGARCGGGCCGRQMNC